MREALQRLYRIAHFHLLTPVEPCALKEYMAAADGALANGAHGWCRIWS